MLVSDKKLIWCQFPLKNAGFTYRPRSKNGHEAAPNESA